MKRSGWGLVASALMLAVTSGCAGGTAPRVVEELLADPSRLDAMATAMRGAARPDAAEEIADELVGLARR